MAVDQSSCPCGAGLNQPVSSGRRRKYCESCRPRKLGYVPVSGDARMCVCGVEFTGNASKKYCSGSCRYRHRPPGKRRGSCSSCGAMVQRTSTSAADIVCHSCRASGVTHGASGYRRGCRCQVCREAAVKRMREYAAKRRAEGRPIQRSRHAQVCLVCGLEFSIRSGSKSQFCSMVCVGIYNREDPGKIKHARSSGKSAFRRRAERCADKAARGRSAGALIWVQGACIVCGDQFLSRGPMSRYCSKECRAKNRQRTFGVSWLDRMALFAADDWKCQICSEPVDYTADPLSDWYPSLDHIIPRSHGGPDDISNLRTAHRWCNSVRGDLSYYTDADLAVIA